MDLQALSPTAIYGKLSSDWQDADLSLSVYLRDTNQTDEAMLLAYC